MPAVADISLSPDGKKIAFISPGPGTRTDLYSIDLDKGNSPLRVTTSSGEPDNLYWCGWTSDIRLACKTVGTTEYAGQLYSLSKVFAVNMDGSDPQLLTKKQGQNALGYSLGGGDIIDWLPGEENKIMMSRYHLAEEKIGTRIAKTKNGLAAEIIDTTNGRANYAERPSEEAVEYITDGIGNVRIKGMRTKLGGTELDSGEIKYFYELDGKWASLGELNYANRTGFNPYAVDAATNRAFGFQPIDGRKALVAIALDGSGNEEVVLKHDKVDVNGLIRIGRKNRVVGGSYALEKRTGIYFDTELANLASALGKALGEDYSVQFSDANLDESKLLIWGGSDIDPGQYFLFDKASKELRPLLGVRPSLENSKLGRVKPISYPAADGTMIPGYLTLPPDSTGKNIPAIVMPHGGPESRDEWGFNWLAQFYVSQGFAVLQPNFRGSAGYGDEWYKKNGFQSWRTSVGDVTDAGKWLVAQGIAKPSALSIVGWSYGGYAALQSAVLAPDLFKAVVAIAPVTDLLMLKNDSKGYYDQAVVRDYVGAGPHIKEGSPAQNATVIKAPVMLFHGEYDRNVEIRHSRAMQDSLKAVSKPVTFVEYKGLEHSLRNSAARIDMLTKSAAFLPK
ncbi:S9 family peptidase [Parasphingorhabdus halotolerans]|uniref:S9 family peptidase n=2 Tax=Parasphingorhabdus halotolerans TaxID=2725558 RepID=A0A6H2DS40_9SPHN|nr:S9 family peptidase [Parasphingorhabdus halotolerans]